MDTNKTSKPPKRKKRKTFDWEKIEREYCLGQKSLRMLSTEFGPAAPTIAKRAKTYAWVQDQSAEVRRRTKAELLRSSRKASVSTQEDLKKAVETNIQVVRAHRKGIRYGQDLVTLLSSQLKDAAENREELKAEAEKECEKPDGTIDCSKRARLQKALSLQTHTAILRDLSTAQKNLIPLERQAFNLDDDSATDGGIKIKIEGWDG